MALDTRAKRSAVVALLVPGLMPVPYPDVWGVDFNDRHIMSWMYPIPLCTNIWGEASDGSSSWSEQTDTAGSWNSQAAGSAYWNKQGTCN